VTFYQKTTLPNGLRVISEEIPYVRSVSVGVWAEAGGIWEQPVNMGSSHFIEHMLFKGTERRNAREIAHAIDGRGGNLNAFTAKEQTCYYAKVLDEHLEVALDVLSDMVGRSCFDSVEIEKEKGVIREEIRMYEDDPDDLVHDLFAEATWGGHALGRPIVGTEATVQSFNRSDLLDFYHTHYRPERVVISVAGNVRHEQVVELVARLFDGAFLPHVGQIVTPKPPVTVERSRAILRTKETEQAHLVVGMEGLCQDHEDMYALHLINTVLGGGASSRLFQEIREQRGLAYSVYSFQSSFRDSGHFGVYAGASPNALPKVLELVMEGYQTFANNGMSQVELDESKEQLKGQVMLGLESTSGRMTRLGRGELMHGRVLSPDQIIQRIEAVTLGQANDLARVLFSGRPKILSAVGALPEELGLSAFGFQEITHV
jgi:predicted Zn-dependent peptidase